MSDDKPENPEEKQPGLSEFLNKMLGGEKGTEEFFAELEPDPMEEAWVGFHEMYLGLRKAGFGQAEACQLMAAYLYFMLLGGSFDGGQP